MDVMARNDGDVEYQHAYNLAHKKDKEDQFINKRKIIRLHINRRTNSTPHANTYANLHTYKQTNKQNQESIIK